MSVTRAEADAGGAVEQQPAVDLDAARVAALAAYDVLERPPRRDLDALVGLAALVCRVPMATINLFTATEQHQVATVGFEGHTAPREESMCDVVLHEEKPVVVTDTHLDDRFRHNAWVTGEHRIRFYASQRLVTPGGVTLGRLCVFDHVPRAVDDAELDALADLTARIVDVLELELRTRELAATVERLEVSEAELARSNAELEGFAGQISHDLRSPLTAITSAHQLMDDVLNSPTPSHDLDLSWLLGRAQHNAGRMTTLIASTLAFASVGGLLTYETVDLGAVLDDVRDDLVAELAHVDVTVGTLPVLAGDRVQLRILLQNLLGNAAKFVVPGERARVEVASSAIPGGWRIWVRDNGTGTGAADPEELFRPFARALETRRVPGTGLGLATCKKIVDAHRGRIGLSETIGGGTTAWFELPA